MELSTQRIILKWAGYFHRQYPRIEKDELVNEVMLQQDIIEKINDPIGFMIDKKVKWIMLDYIRNYLRLRQNHANYEKNQAYVRREQESHEKKIDNKDYITNLLDKISLKDAYFLLELFWLEKSPKQMAQERNITKQRISQIKQRIFKNLRRIQDD